MKRILAVALALSAISLMPRRASAEMKIAYVDMQRAFEETDDGKKAKSKLKAEFDKKQKELDARQEELKKMKGDIDRQATVLTKDAIDKKTQELQQKVVQLQETYMRLQKDLQEKEATEMQRIFRKMQAIVAQIAQADGVSFVFDKNAGLLYAPPSLDLTNELIRKYNASGGGAK